MILYLPSLDPRLAVTAPEGVLFLDPGLPDVPDGRSYRPDGLPRSEREASAALAGAMGFGEQMGGERGLTGVAASGINDFYSETSLAVGAELRARDQGERQGATDLGAARAAAQLFLLLAWATDRSLAEVRELETRLDAGRERFNTSLGFGDEDKTEMREMGLSPQISPTTAPLPEELLRTWRKRLESMLLLVPEETAFWVDAPQLLAELEEAGVTFEALVEVPGGTALAATAPLGHIIGDDGARPWLARQVTLLRPAPEGGV